MSKIRISRVLPIVGAPALAWSVACSSAGSAAPPTPDGGKGVEVVTPPVDAGTEAGDLPQSYTRLDDMEGTGPSISWTAPAGMIPVWLVGAETPEFGQLLSPGPGAEAWSYAQVPTPYETFPGITSTHAARVRTLAPLVNTYGAEMALLFARLADAGVPRPPVHRGYDLGSADLSAYKGITFWGMADPSRTTTVRMKIFETNTWPEAGPCLDSDGGTGNCFNGFGAVRTFTGSFERYTIDFAELAQDPSWGYQARVADLKHVYYMGFEVNTPGGASPSTSLTFDIWIDDLYFVNR
ncbi:MAG: hypothetical protein M3O36_00970 [Myxococcota bacterium]|nr:hypothetical protein [Myxococcota bacterium]